MATRTPKQHVEEIRRKKFSIGGERNPLTEDLHQAVRNLSAELYTKDVHFLMELIQNAEDNEYLEGVDPSLEFVITSRDITATGAPATLLLFNNEKGFSPKNIESICSVGRSTKKGNRKRGYIGEKGIGFKSVFLITAQPYIFSNGYQIRFNEGPCPHCDLGYIVPEWVEENPTLSDIRNIYGPGSTLPTTTIVLPLKPDKVGAVKQQLSCVHPEILLFLLKIKRLSVREYNEDPKLNTVNKIAITSETDIVSRKNIDAESYTVHLAAEENGGTVGNECGYYMWKQKFPVREESRVERRMEVDEWTITLAFPYDERLNRGMSSPGVYAFLPTEMITNFPFIIQADFLLSSSRETILLDDRWNQGILGCVPEAFVNAFISLVVKVTNDAPVSSLVQMFNFIPLNESSYRKFNVIRDTIRTKLMQEDIIPSDTGMEQIFFHKPCEVARIMPAFWDILEKARKAKVSLQNLSFDESYNILHSSFDMPEYDPVLNFLGVGYVESEWYSKCIKSTNLALRVPEDVYLELLLFLAHNWCSKFHASNIKNIPLLKYVDLNGHVSLCSISEAAQLNARLTLCLSQSPSYTKWLIDCNKEFRCVADHFFMPSSSRDAIVSFSKKRELLEWLLQHVNVRVVDVKDYATVLKHHLRSDRKLVIMYTHFLYHSLSKSYLSAGEVDNLCGSPPLVDSYGCVSGKGNGVLVPADGSKWAHLIDSTNLWRKESFVVLGEDYLRPATFAGAHTPAKVLLEFLKSHVGVSDVPYISAPDARIPAVNAPLSKENTFLLLAWIRNLIYIPENFLSSVKEGCWLRVTINGSSDCRPPSNSFFPSSSWGDLLQNGSVLVDIPLIDRSFYGDGINDYKEELKRIGVMLEYGDACQYIGKRLMLRAASCNLSGGHVISILNFIRYLREKMLSPEHFIKSIKEVRWLRTSQGNKSPAGAVLFDQGWKFASEISDIPFIDQAFYGDEISSFKEELKLLGVMVGFSGNHQVVIDHLKSALCLTALKAEAFLLALRCMHSIPSSDKPVAALKNTKCVKTSLGYKSPGECFLPDPEWGCILQIFGGFAIIDYDHYGISIFLYRNELKRLGVVMEPERAFKQFSQTFKRQASLRSITKENVLSFLSCYRTLMRTSHKFPEELKGCIGEEKWLRTKLGDFRSPRDCILFGPQWEAVVPITTLPFIDDTDKFYGKEIHEYKEELKKIGVVVGLEKGVEHVVSGLYLPHDPGHITPASVLSLLQCVRILLKDSKYSFPEAFLKKISGKWLKTTVGYRSPHECLLFNYKFKLKQMDGPFIDESFYGSSFSNYKNELMALGVCVDVDVGKGCRLLACHLHFHSDFETIRRVYEFLQEVGWKPESESEAAREIWIPGGCEKGFWTSPEKCVLHDKDGLFGMHLNVLENRYDDKLLSFFSGAFGVRSNPLSEDYCKLWKTWEESGELLSHAKCCAFWKFFAKCRSSVRVKELADHLLKLPVDSSSEEVLLSDKRDVFIADDLEMKDLFAQAAPHPIFVWYPQQSSPLLRQSDLLELYQKMGVHTISESVQKEEVSLSKGQEFKQVHGQDFWIRKGLVSLILAFLAGPVVKMEVNERQETVKSLLNTTVLETEEPILVRCSLTLSSGEILNVQATRFIRWDRKNSKLFTHKLDRTSGEKDRLQYATYFSQVIAQGILWQHEDQSALLSKLIKLGFLVEFNEEAVDFLMKSENLQVFKEDEGFLSAVFTSRVADGSMIYAI